MSVVSAVAEQVVARGMVYVHSAPSAMCPHVKWAIERVMGQQIALDWQRQPAGRGLMRIGVQWTGAAGTGAALASALRACTGVRFEVVEDASPGVDGARWSHTPTLGTHHSRVSANGDIVVNEDRVRAALRHRGVEEIREALDHVLGTAWDDELEEYRYCGDNQPVRWLHRVS